jgi:hypothetical protein
MWIVLLIEIILSSCSSSLTTEISNEVRITQTWLWTFSSRDSGNSPPARGWLRPCFHGPWCQQSQVTFLSKTHIQITWLRHLLTYKISRDAFEVVKIYSGTLCPRKRKRAKYFFSRKLDAVSTYKASRYKSEALRLWSQCYNSFS